MTPCISFYRRRRIPRRAEKFEKFKKRYAEELSGNPDTEKFISLIREELQKGPVTLLYGAKDEIHNQAVVLKEFLKDK